MKLLSKSARRSSECLASTQNDSPPDEEDSISRSCQLLLPRSGVRSSMGALLLFLLAIASLIVLEGWLLRIIRGLPFPGMPPRDRGVLFIRTSGPTTSSFSRSSADKMLDFREDRSDCFSATLVRLCRRLEFSYLSRPLCTYVREETTPSSSSPRGSATFTLEFLRLPTPNAYERPAVADMTWKLSSPSLSISDADCALTSLGDLLLPSEKTELILSDMLPSNFFV